MERPEDTSRHVTSPDVIYGSSRRLGTTRTQLVGGKDAESDGQATVRGPYYNDDVVLNRDEQAKLN